MSQDLNDNCTPEPQPQISSADEASKEMLRTGSMVQHAQYQPSQVQPLAPSGLPIKATSPKAADEKPEYRIIGIGTCGTVFEIPGTYLAIKKGKDVKAMWNDFLLTNTVYNAILDTRESLQDAFPSATIPKAPRCTTFYLPTSDNYWTTNLSKFPTSHRKIGAAFEVDRIPPVPQDIREILMDEFFDEKDMAAAKHDPDNADCLIRIYLGENETERQQCCGYDSLRNFPLRLNMLSSLSLDADQLATEMAITLATIHWQAQVDGMDIEFVLAASSVLTIDDRRRAYVYDYDSTTLPPSPQEVRPPHYRTHFQSRFLHLYVLDFDKSSPITLTSADVDTKLVPAFLGNDSYYPRPDVDGELWDIFRVAYGRASRVILGMRGFGTEGEMEEGRLGVEGVMELPGRFLEKVVEMVELHGRWDPESDIVFGE